MTSYMPNGILFSQIAQADGVFVYGRIRKNGFSERDIPPLPEQQCLVVKVDELMALCDKLEAQLTTTHTDSCRLLEAVLHDTLCGQRQLEPGVHR
jgi:hypothetical protein